MKQENMIHNSQTYFMIYSKYKECEILYEEEEEDSN